MPILSQSSLSLQSFSEQTGLLGRSIKNNKIFSNLNLMNLIDLHTWSAPEGFRIYEASTCTTSNGVSRLRRVRVRLEAAAISTVIKSSFGGGLMHVPTRAVTPDTCI